MCSRRVRYAFVEYIRGMPQTIIWYREEGDKTNGGWVEGREEEKEKTSRAVLKSRVT